MTDWYDGFEPVAEGPDTLYGQVADFIASRIDGGRLAHGAKLPPERDMAVYLGVSYDTVRRAMGVLRDRGLIRTQQGRGTFAT
jgi:DNA-binding GntR family transcriptional regulator